MANSLRAKLSKLRYKGEITQEEYAELIKKLNGHDSELLDNVADKLKTKVIICDNCEFAEYVDEVIAEMKAEKAR